MAMTTTELVKFYAPELDPGDDSADDKIGKAIDVAARRVNAKTFDAMYQDAVALMAAHLLVLGERTAAHAGASGAIQSEKTGDWSRTYAVPSDMAGATSDKALGQTGPGLQYLEIRGTRVATTGRLIT